MRVDKAKTFRLIVTAGFAIAGCAPTTGLAVHAKDSGATSLDLAPERDLSSDQSLGERDAAASVEVAIADTFPQTPDLGQDIATPDTVTNKDAGVDSPVVPKDSASEPVAQDVAADGGGALACTGTPAFGIWPLTDTGTTYPTGNFPISVALGDLNGDGTLDIVSANQDSDTASVLLGKGDGSFASNVDYPTGSQPTAVVMGDLSGDGRLDLAVMHDQSVSVLLGKGDGSLAANVDYPAGSQLTAIALGDLNGDGKLDIVVTNAVGPSGTAIVLLGTGGGMFAGNLAYQVGIYPNGVALGDLNGDGKSDIVVANTGADGYWSASVLLGKGDGTFAAKVDYDTGHGPSAVRLGDLNGDGNLDIIMSSSIYLNNVDTVTVLLGKGDGTFAAKVEYGTGVSPNSVALGDFNGDGWLDVVTSNFGDSPQSGGVSLLLGKGDGTFATKLDYLVADPPSSIAVGDLNDDGWLDIVTTGGNSVDVLLGSCR